MSVALSALRELEAIANSMRRPPALPAISACQQQADLLPDHATASAQPPDDVLEALRRELRQVCGDDGATALSPKTLRRAPLVFWHGEPQAAGFPGLLATFLEGAADRPRWLQQLIEAWLRDFDPTRIALPQTGRDIIRLLLHAKHPRLRSWKDAHERYGLFDAAQGPRRLARALVYGPEEVTQVLQYTGMVDPLRAEGGFFRAVTHALCDAVPTALRSHAATAIWHRIAATLEVSTVKTDRTGREVPTTRLRFAELSGKVARACLDPWLTGPAPTHAPREEIKAFLVRTIGDPRLDPARWTEAGEGATRLMRSWLAVASLEAFLSLISQTNDDKQWRYRQAFWRACLRKMPTAEVWVVLGPGLAGRAKAIRDLRGSFGRIHANAASADQAVLLMRLGDLVLSEWSNVGAVRAWNINDRRCPRLYRLDPYTVDELRTPCLDFPDHPTRGNGGSHGGKGLWHHAGHNGLLWQGCAAALLAERLHLRLTPEDYTPQ